jgi:MerR family redox-sensitive transcriptional activator SoxR
MRIGELSDATGVSTRTLRYYEQQGLVTSSRRSNGYRDFGVDAVEVVELIQDLFSAGLPSRLLREIVPCVAGATGPRHESARPTDRTGTPSAITPRDPR